MLYANKDKITLINQAALVCGSAPVSSKEVLGGVEDRPNGLYGYAYALLITLVFAATPSSTDHCAAKKLWQVLKSVSIQYAKSFKRCNNFTGLNILRLGVQADELYSPDLIASAIPVQEYTDSQGATTCTMHILYPLAIKRTKPVDDDLENSYTGFIPLSALKDGGEIAVQICASTTISTNWTIGTVALKVDMLTFATVDPLPHVAVYEVWQDYATGRAVLPGDGDRLYSAILGTDDTDGDFTLPTSMVVNCDGKVIRNLTAGADLVLEENLARQDGINDILPACCPVLTMVGKKLDEGLVAHNAVVIEGMNDNHGTPYGVLVRYSQNLDANTQRDMLKKHRVPAELIDRYIAEQQARTTAQVEREVGRVTGALRVA